MLIPDLDVEAGIRAYTGPRDAKRFWHGYYNGKAMWHFTGGVIPLVESASVQEHVIFESHYDLVHELLGNAPETAIGDKGLSIASAFAKCTTNGTAPVFPWRPGGGDVKRHDNDTHDRHCIPRCQHCGGPGDFVRFSPGNRSLPAERRQPRIWFRCMVGATPSACLSKLSPARPTTAYSCRCGEPTRSTWSSGSRTAPTRPHMTGGATGTRSRQTTSASAPRCARGGSATHAATTATPAAATATARSASPQGSRTCVPVWAWRAPAARGEPVGGPRRV